MFLFSQLYDHFPSEAPKHFKLPGPPLQPVARSLPDPPIFPQRGTEFTKFQFETYSTSSGWKKAPPQATRRMTAKEDISFHPVRPVRNLTKQPDHGVLVAKGYKDATAGSWIDAIVQEKPIAPSTSNQQLQPLMEQPESFDYNSVFDDLF